MQQTLVAVFDHRSDAQKAMEELVACGYPREQVRLSEGDPAGDARRADVDAEADDRNFMSGIRHFFSDLFGTDRSESALMYSEAISRGNYVLTLTAASMLEVERAADIVERFGPLDIDEHATLWKDAHGARTGRRALQQSQPGSQQYAQQDTEQRAGTTAKPVIQDQVEEGKRQAQRGGVRIYGRAVETPVGTEMEMVRLAPEEEAYFRGHWSRSYAGDGGKYDDYVPAYTYGSSMARSDLYRGRPWEDVERNLRSDWEARNPDSAWEKVKAAIRHGWERIAS